MTRRRWRVREALAAPLRTPRGEGVAVGLLAVLVAGLSTYHLDRRSIWLDEAVTAAIARVPDPGASLSDGGNMAAYYLMMRGWTVLGDGLWMLRLPSVVFAAVGIVLLYLLARHLLGPREAAIAAGLTAINSSVVFYGQEARSYTMLFALTTASWLVLTVALERRSFRWFVLWGLLNGLAVATHLFYVLVLPAQLAAVFLLPRSVRPWRGLATGTAVLCAAAVPVAFAAAGRGTVQIDWIPPASGAAFRQILLFLGGANFEPSDRLLPTLFGGAVLIAWMVSWSLGAFVDLRTFGAHGRSWPSFRNGVSLLWLALPLVLSVGISLTVQPLLVPRYFIALIPAGSMLAAQGIAQLRRPALQGGALALLVLLSLVGVGRSYGTGDWGWQRVAAELSRAADPGDAVVVLPSYQRLSLDYHLNRLGAGPTLEFISPRARSWRPPEASAFGVAGAFYAAAPPQEAALLAAQHAEFWLVTSDFTRWDGEGRVVEALAQARTFFGDPDRFRIVTGRAIGRVGLLLVQTVEPASRGGAAQ